MLDRFKTFTLLITNINRSIRKIKTEEMAEYNLKSIHISCLYYLYKSEYLTAKELCDICDEDKAAMSRSIDYLERNNFIKCESSAKKGGRISAVTAFAGEMLSIKPVVGVIKGEVKVIGKAMGSKKANNLLNQLIEKTNGINFNMPFGTIWSGLDDTTLQKYIEDSKKFWYEKTNEIPKYILGATIGTHIGPGAAGVAFFEN